MMKHIIIIFLLMYSSFAARASEDNAVGTIPGNFQVSPTGAATYDIPIECPPGTAGMVPHISISYNSQAGFGQLGRGWLLNATSVITRVGKNLYLDGETGAVNFDSDDRFALDGNRLMLVAEDSGTNEAVYKTEFYDFSKITSYGTRGNPYCFIVETKDGRRLEYGTSSDSRMMGSYKNHVLKWFLKKETDAFGNYICYKYIGRDSFGEFRISSIKYTGNKELEPYNEVDFIYKSIKDSRVLFLGGERINQDLVLDRIYGRMGRTVVCEYVFEYESEVETKLTQIYKYGKNQHFNPTSFKWDESPIPGYRRYVDDDKKHNRKIKTEGDYNGDGKNDFIRIAPDSKELELYQYEVGSSPFSKIFTIPFDPVLSPYSKFVTADLNSDGKDDLLLEGFKKQNDGKNSVELDLWISNGSGFTHLGELSGRNMFGEGANNGEIHAMECSLGDFDGNGRLDLLFINTEDKESTKWKIFSAFDENSFPVSDVKFIYDEISGTGLKEAYSGVGAVFAKETSVCVYNGEKDICNPLYSRKNSGFLDVNGDGKTDILYFNGFGDAYAMTFNDSTFEEIFFSPKLRGVTIEDFEDHNSDGLVDLLTNQGIFYSTGKGFAKSSDDSSYGTYYGDFNGDGKKDKLQVRYMPPNDAYFRFLVEYKEHSGFSDPELLFSLPADQTASFSIRSIKDFNGDGKDDILYHIYKTGSDFVFFSIRDPGQRICSITNGLGYKTSIAYLPMTNSAVYEKGTSSVFPFCDVLDARYLVSTVSTSNGIGGDNEISYEYSGLRKHLQGRGELGFTTITQCDYSKHTILVNTYELDSSFLFPYLKKQENSLENGPMISSSVFTMQVKNFGNNCIFPYNEKIVNNSVLYGTTNTSTYAYDNYGNQTQVYTDYNGDGTTKVENDYVRAGAWIPSKASVSKITKIAKGKTPVSNTTCYAYNNLGGLVFSIDGAGGASKSIKTSYSYNSYGLPVVVTVKGSDVEGSRTTRYEYDSKSRFVTKTTNGVGQITTATYDFASGNVLTSTDVNGLVTSFEYDGLGRRTKTTFPDGTVLNNSLSWSSSSDPSNSVYYSLSTSTSSPFQKIYFDVLGREIRTETEGFGENNILTQKNFNSEGQVSSEQGPCYTFSNCRIKVYRYDSYGRVNHINGQTDDMTITYNGLTQSMNSSAMSKEYTFNALGQVISVEDNGGTITYDYNSWGQPVAVTTGGTHVTTMDYNDRMQQTSLIEPNLGTISYAYNAFGELTTQSQNGITSTLTYDKLGRVLTHTETEGTTTYTYDTRTNGKGLISSVINSNGDGKKYYYDAYSRVSSIGEMIDGVTYTESIGYNGSGRLSSLTYPSGFGIIFNYNNHFYLRQVKRSDNNAAIWTANSMNAYGQVTLCTLGNNLVTNKTYNLGLVTSIITHTPTSSPTFLQNLTYEWNVLTGNLSHRRENIHTLKEDFSYDNLNRLTQVAINGGATTNFTYKANGNIESSTVAGNYTYDPVKTNAVINVTPPQDVISHEKQIATYTSFNKMKQITEGANSATLNYGVDKQRIKMVLSDGSSILTRIYTHGNYEVESGSKNRKIHYISTPDGLSAMYIIDGNNNNGAMYYIHKDHLGSVNVITDETGNIVDEYSFDAWGRRRNPADWTYRNIESGHITDRGFTGHEHLDQFGLINMNGRMYAPVIGRFLSPDKYVQKPQFTQSFNRYSYCMNNPLNVVDPSGWWGSNTSGGAGEKNYYYLPYYMYGRGQGNSYYGRTIADWALAHELSNDAWIYASSPRGSYNSNLVNSGAVSFSRCDYYVNTDGYVDGKLVSHSRKLVRSEVIASSQGAAWAGIAITSTATAATELSLMAAASSAAVGAMPFALAGDTDDNIRGKIVYRGVATNHPDYPNALKGIATPIGGHNNPKQHNLGNTKSIFTSWSFDRNIANYYANKSGTPGVVLVYRVSPNRMVPSPDFFNQREVLIIGVVTGATVTAPTGSGYPNLNRY